MIRNTLTAAKASMYCCMLLLGFISVPIGAQDFGSRSDQLSVLDELIPSLMRSQQIPGFAVGVVGNGEPAGIRTYGIASIDSDTPVSTETVFEIASTSKPLFAIAVMQLVEKGILDLDTPAYKYAEFEYIVNDERRKKITLRMLLNHTSGLPNALSKGQKPAIAFEPGTEYFYSGWGFRYLQKIVEEVTGQTLTQVMEDLIFDPIGMNKASYLWRSEFESIAADGHSADGSFSRDIVKLSTEYAEGGIITDISELTRFVDYVLKEYQSENQLLLSMTKPSVLVKDFGSSGSMSRGLGWIIEETPSGTSIWHGGSNGAFKALVFIDLERESGLAILSNSANGLTIASQLVSTLFGAHHLLGKYYASD